MHFTKAMNFSMVNNAKCSAFARRNNMSLGSNETCSGKC